MVNNSHQYQQSEETPRNSDGQQFTPISTKRTSSLNIDGQQFNQYQQSKQPHLNSDDKQFQQNKQSL